MRRTYETLLRLYPSDYRQMFGAEMLHTLGKGIEEGCGRGWRARTRFIIWELIGLVKGAGAEWVAKLTTDKYVRGRCLPDVRMMRPPGVSRELWFGRASANAERSIDSPTRRGRRECSPDISP